MAKWSGACGGGSTAGIVRGRSAHAATPATSTRRSDASAEPEASQRYAGAETFGEYVTGTWAASHAPTLAAKTRLHYASLYDHHLRPYLGSMALREITPEVIGRWQADRLAAGAGPIAVRHAMDLLGSILEHAFVGGHISANPARRVKKARSPRREEVQPLSPATIEAMRAALDGRDATLISVLAYAGLRPGEALGLRWGDVREQTLLIQRAISLGEESDTKTRQHRTVRLLAALAADLRSWRMAAGRPGDSEFVFPGKEGRPWTQAAYQSWRRRAFNRSRSRPVWHMLARMTCATASRRC